jgi:hypothetical protein
MYDRKKRRIFLVGLILSAGLYWGVPETACPHTSVRESIQNVKTGPQLSLKVPQGQGFVAEEEKEGVPTRGEEKPQPKTPKPQAEPEKKGWPLKKFVPSEKIPADQAVDFPADI